MLYNEDQIQDMLYRGLLDDEVITLIESGRYDEFLLRRARIAANLYLEIVGKMLPVSSG
jgi:hypothetical protein